jgi:hypothetical protein
MNQEISNRIDKFIEIWNQKNVEHMKANFASVPPDLLTRRDGKKYIKLVKGGTSCYAFVDAETGDIFKPASWHAPAKHSRGNVKSDDFGISCSGPYGIAYLRGGSGGGW